MLFAEGYKPALEGRMVGERDMNVNGNIVSAVRSCERCMVVLILLSACYLVHVHSPLRVAVHIQGVRSSILG